MGWVYLQSKKTKSKALFQYLPQSEYVARINTKEAIRLLLKLDKDSFKVRNKSKWAKLFKNPEETGIDLLVNPWFFSINSQFCVAFSIKSTDKFNSWMKVNCDSAMGEIQIKDEPIKYFQFKGRPISFFSNFDGIGLVCYGNRSREVATSFYGKGNSGSKPFEMNKELVQIKLHQKVDLLDNLFTVKDSSLKLYVTDSSLRINELEEPSLKQAFLFKKDFNKRTFNKYKETKLLRSLFQFMGLKDIILNDKVSMSFSIGDTIQKHIKTVTYEYNDNFEKVEVNKVKTSILPDLTLCFEFNDSLSAFTFFNQNKLFNYRSKMFQVNAEGANVFISSSIHCDRLSGLDYDVLYLRKDKFEFVSNKCKGLNFIPMERLKNLEYVYLKQDSINTAAILQTSVHPLKFFINSFSDSQL